MQGEDNPKTTICTDFYFAGCLLEINIKAFDIYRIVILPIDGFFESRGLRI